MKRSSVVLLIVALVLMGAGGFWILGAQKPASPDVLITQTLKDMENGARRRNTNAVLEGVSDEFNSGGLSKDRLRLLLIRSFRQSQGVEYDAHINAPRILPSPKNNPNERLVFTRASVFYTGTGENIWGSDTLTLVMRQETRRKWLVLREPYWRVVSIANLPPLPGVGDDSGGSLF